MPNVLAPLASSGVTFAVHDVAASSSPLPTQSSKDTIRTLAQRRGVKLDSWSRETELDSQVMSGLHGSAFVATLNAAYDNHYPLVLSPDMIWLLIAQGFAAHVNANAEALRSRFVDFNGKKMLFVRRDDFIKGFEGNPWEEVFPAFTNQIRDNIGVQAYECAVQSFSTTGPIEQAAMEITLMDAMQAYFEYTFVTCCGFPQITLEGTTSDWQKVLHGAQAMATYELDWWIDPLTPVLEQFVAASRGDVDMDFWKSFYKLGGGSGGPYIGGHMINLFPYLGQRNQGKNRWLGRGTSISMMDGPTSDDFPSGLSVAPFKWEYHHLEFPMEFVAGFLGATQNPDTLALRPRVGWAVFEKRA